MRHQFNPQMIQLGRELREKTRSELAHQCGVTQSFISRVENGEREISEEKARVIASELGLPLEFFSQEGQYTGLGVSLFHYRKRASTLVKHMRRLQAEACLRRIQIGRLLRGMEIGNTSRTFRHIDIDDVDGGPEEIANIVRANWMLPLGPIPNLTACIENAGGVVCKFSFGTRDIDAMSQWPDDLDRPIFFVNADAPADRARFSLAHELAHVTMHRSATSEMESEADRFAVELLMPRREIEPELDEITLRRAADLKSYWRVSMAALIRRAYDLKRIDQDRYQQLMRTMSSMGMRRTEPVEIASEEPRFLSQILDTYQIGNGYSLSELARLSKVFDHDFVSRYMPASAGLRLAQ